MEILKLEQRLAGIGGVAVLLVIAWYVIFSVKIDPAEVGILVDMYGSDKGVDQVRVLGTGRSFYNPITHDVIKYPAFIQQTSYPTLQFQDVDGLIMTADVGVSYKFVEENIPKLYIEYRKGANHILSQYFPVWIKNAMVKEASNFKVDEIYGAKKEEYRQAVLTSLQKDFKEKGIFVEDIYFTNGINIPANVSNRIDEKIKATQIAQQKENELRAVEADVAKKIAEEEGKAQSRLIEAESRAEANAKLNASLNANVLRFKELELQKEAIEKWNGTLPTVTSSDGGMILDLSQLQ